MSLRISSAALGAAWVTQAIAETLDPILEKHNLPIIREHAPFVPIHLGLLVLGNYG